jgi:hypothetical protein
MTLFLHRPGEALGPVVTAISISGPYRFLVERYADRLRISGLGVWIVCRRGETASYNERYPTPAKTR